MYLSLVIAWWLDVDMRVQKKKVSEITGEVLSTEIVQHDATPGLLSLSRVGKLLLQTISF
jgi:hypothetical protein